MRDYKIEAEKRVRYIADLLQSSGARGVIFANSGGKDCALVGILSKLATANVLGVILPCGSKRNYEQDAAHAHLLAGKFGIENVKVDLTPARDTLVAAFPPEIPLPPLALQNIAPRLRMTTVYALGQASGYLVAGTGNACEIYLGYFTKWGDGGYDFNPIADLTVTEIFEFLRYLGAPNEIIDKPPSAGLYDGQTDEDDMGVTYAQVEAYMRGEPVNADAAARIAHMHARSENKRHAPSRYGE